MSDAVRDLFMSIGFEGVSAIKELEGVNKKADETKKSIQDIGETAGKIGATFETRMSGLDKGFKLWESNSGKFTTTLEKKQKRIELLKDKTSLLEKEIDKTSGEISEATKKYGENSEAAKKLENQLLDLKIQQADYNNELKNLNSFDWNALDKIGDKFTKIGGVMTAGVTTPLVGIGIAGTKTFIELEDAFAGVEKTVDATGPQLESLREKLNSLVTDKNIPIKVTEMYGIAEAAGQLGIKMGNIEGFSEVMAKLGTATNMTSQQAATDLARFANIVQMPQENFDRLGSTIVALGNNLATTESEITSMGLRLSGAGRQIGLAESEILGLAGALSSVGIESEAGGSAFSKVMIGMQNAVMNMGADLDVFASVSGKSVDDFKQLFEKDAAGALVNFTEGLGRLQKDGVNTNDILDNLGFSEVRVSDALRRAANSGDVFRNALNIGNKAWQENIALNQEAEKKYEKTAAKIEVFKNKVTLLSEKIGGDLKDKFNGLLEVGTKAVDWLSNLDDSTRKTVVTIGMVAAAVGPVFMAVGMGIKAVKGIRDTITDLGKGIKMIKGAFSSGGKAITFLTSPIGLTILAIGALIAIGYVLYKNWDKITVWFKDKFPGAFKTITGVINGVKTFIASNMGSFKVIFKGFTDFVGGILKGDFEKAFGGAEGIVSGFCNILNSLVAPLQNKFPNAFKFLSGVIANFKSTVSNIIGSVKTIFGGITEFVSGVFSGNWSQALNGLGNIFKGVFDLMKNTVSGTLNNIFGLFDMLIAPLQEKFTFVFNVLSGTLNIFKNTVFNVIGGVQKIFNGFIDFVAGVFTGDWSKAWQGVKDIFGGIFSTLAALIKAPLNLAGNLFNAVIKGISGKLKGTSDYIKNTAGEIFNSISGFFQTLIAPLQEKFPHTFEMISNALNIFKNTAADIIGNVKQIFGGIINFITGIFTGNWDKAWQGVRDIFGGVFSNIADLIKTPLNLAINLINTAIQGINGNIKIKIPDWSPIFGGKELGFNIPTIPMLAKGTDYHIGGPAIVGEKGPEIVNLNKGDTVTPADKTNKILASLGRRRREETPDGYSINKFADNNDCGFKKQMASLMAKFEITIQKIIIQGEVTPGKIENLKREIKAIFKEAWEEAWYELCLKYPNLTEL